MAGLVGGGLGRGGGRTARSAGNSTGCYTACAHLIPVVVTVVAFTKVTVISVHFSEKMAGSESSMPTES